nr:unnamed protein product [Digitaria exilis]
MGVRFSSITGRVAISRAETCRGGRHAGGAFGGDGEGPAAREYGSVDLDQHLLVVLLELPRREGDAVVRGGGAVGRAGAVPDRRGGGQPEHGRDVRVAEPHQPPPRRQRAEQAPAQLPAAAAHAPPAAEATGRRWLVAGDAIAAAAELGNGERRAALRGGGVDAVVASPLPVRLDAALVRAVVHTFVSFLGAGLLAAARA